MTPQGDKLLTDWYNRFRREYVEQHEGCNENDVERAFLWAIAPALRDSLCMSEAWLGHSRDLEIIESIH